MTLCVSCPEGHLVSVAPDKLGRAVSCPCCLARFRADLDQSAARHARKEEKKTRRSRDDDDDDDDDDEEEEKPRKKKPAEPKKKETKPPVKKTTRKKEEVEEEEDEEDEEADDEADPEAEIDWTPRKRQLSLCTIGLSITVGAFSVMIIFTAVATFFLDWFIFYDVMQPFQASKTADVVQKLVVADYVWLAAFTAAPFFALAQLILLVALFFNLSVPAKAEARSLALSGIVFGILTFVFGILVLLAYYQVVVSDEVRAERMMQLTGGGAGLCFVISLMSTMAFQAKLMMFMNMKLEASQAVTNVGFYFVFLAGTFAAFFASIYICNYLHYYLGYAVIFGSWAGAGLAGRSLSAQIALMLKQNKTIQIYIREAV